MMSGTSFAPEEAAAAAAAGAGVGAGVGFAGGMGLESAAGAAEAWRGCGRRRSWRGVGPRRRRWCEEKREGVARGREVWPGRRRRRR
jgi:hypothetical protein